VELILIRLAPEDKVVVSAVLIPVKFNHITAKVEEAEQARLFFEEAQWVREDAKVELFFM
jgi:hypothetical protein